MNPSSKQPYFAKRTVTHPGPPLAIRPPIAMPTSQVANTSMNGSITSAVNGAPHNSNGNGSGSDNIRKKSNDAKSWLERCYDIFNSCVNTTQSDKIALQKELRARVECNLTKSSFVDWNTEPLPDTLMRLTSTSSSSPQSSSSNSRRHSHSHSHRHTTHGDSHSHQNVISPHSRNVRFVDRNTNRKRNRSHSSEMSISPSVSQQSSSSDNYNTQSTSIRFVSTNANNRLKKGKKQKKKNRNAFDWNDDGGGGGGYTHNDSNSDRMSALDLSEVARIEARRNRFKGQNSNDDQSSSSHASAAPPPKKKRRLSLPATTHSHSHSHSHSPASAALHFSVSQSHSQQKKSLSSGGGVGVGSVATENMRWMDCGIVGTSKKLEKQYFRLTSEPKPSEVRDIDTCRAAFKLVSIRWRSYSCSKSDKRDYEYVGGQLKSLRQDLKVQHICDKFTVELYECNARICLEVGDFSEYNQCQTQLNELYKLSRDYRDNFVEFLVYRLLYSAVTKHMSATLYILKKYPQYKHSPQIAYAREIIRALRNLDYIAFFKNCAKLNRHSQLLLSQITFKVRFAALQNITSAYSPTMFSVSKLTVMLGFESMGKCLEYLRNCNCVTDGKNQRLNCKKSRIQLKEYIPKSTDNEHGVTHGNVYAEKQGATLAPFLLQK